MRTRTAIAALAAALLAVAPLASAAVSVVFAERFGQEPPPSRGVLCAHGPVVAEADPTVAPVKQHLAG